MSPVVVVDAGNCPATAIVETGGGAFGVVGDESPACRAAIVRDRVFLGCSEIMNHCVSSVPVTKSPGSKSTEGHREKGKKNTQTKRKQNKEQAKGRETRSNCRERVKRRATAAARDRSVEREAHYGERRASAEKSTKTRRKLVEEVLKNEKLKGARRSRW